MFTIRHFNILSYLLIVLNNIVIVMCHINICMRLMNDDDEPIK